MPTGKSNKPRGELNMSVSSVVGEGKDKKIYIRFSDRDRSCEGVYPDCLIHSSVGFSPEEIKSLEAFMKENEKTIKDMAKTVSIWKAFAGSDNPFKSK